MPGPTALPQTVINPVPAIAGGVGEFDQANYTQNPVLVPDFYTPVCLGGGISMLSPNDLLGQPGYARTNATATGTIGGTVATGHTLTLTFTNGAFKDAGGARSVTYATSGGETATTAALGLTDAINSDPVLRGFGIYATAVGAVVTINHPGPIGQFTTVTFATTGAETCTFSPVSGTLAGGGGAVYPFNSFRYAYSNQTFQFRARLPVVIPQPILVAMVRDGMPIS
jgi:hypothetical protein